MKLNDFNLHLALTQPSDHSGDPNPTIGDDTTMDWASIEKSYRLQRQDLLKSTKAANIMVFNPHLSFKGDQFSKIREIIRKDMPDSVFTFLMDPRIVRFEEFLEEAFAKGIDGIKFHAYIQDLSNELFAKAVKVAQFAESRKKFICIDTSYGTTRMYSHDNLKLSCAIADKVSKVPLILLHSGCSRVFEAMLIAEDKKNVYLDTSFALHYFEGSSLIQDFAFAYKKIGAERVLYGSDSPYVSLSDSEKCIHEFLDLYHFSSREKEYILGKTYEKLKNEI